MDEHELTDRMQAFGEADVPADTRAEHLRRIAATPITSARRFSRAWVAAAAIVGFFAGSTGLAAAGALPDPAQDVAHDVLSVVQVDVPEGKRGPCVSAIAKSDLPKAEKKAAKDACPKGGDGAIDENESSEGENGNGKGRSNEAPGQTKHVDDPCKGKPAWAGKNDLTVEEKDALKAERATTCGSDLDDGDEDDAGDEDAGDVEIEDQTADESGG